MVSVEEYREKKLGLERIFPKKPTPSELFLEGLINSRPFIINFWEELLNRENYLNDVYTKETILRVLGARMHPVFESFKEKRDKLNVPIIGVEGISDHAWPDSQDERYFSEIKKIIAKEYQPKVSKLVNLIFSKKILYEKELDKVLNDLVRTVKKIVSNRSKLSSESGRGLKAKDV
jgi:hypothetical protein